MLTVTKLADAEYTLTQVAEGVEEYYLGIGEAPGVWHGRWAARLGLEGVIDGDDLRVLLDGCDPWSGENLLAGRPVRTVKAFDATFSAPKSVSLLWAFGTAETAAVISIAHTEAVSQALSLLEDKTAVARQQTNGVRINVATDGLAVAMFTHRTSRDGDPQLHTHCVIPNVIRRVDGSHVSIAGHGLWEWKKAVGGIYQEQLRRLLTERLGAEWGTDRNGCREMLGLTSTQLRTFSKRTVEIEQRLEAAGVDRDDRVAWMRADDKASLATRPAKDKTLTPARLQERWRDEAARAGIPLGLDLDAAATGRRVEAPSVMRDDVFARLVDPGVGLCARRARFGPADVVEHIAAMDPGQLTIADVEQLAGEFLASDLVVRLVDRDRDGDSGQRRPRCWSTTAHLEVERHVLGQLDRLSSSPQTGIDSHKLEAAIANHSRLGLDQADAVRVLCGPGPAVRALIAPAGYGKTTTVTVAARAYEAAGRPVIAVAPTNQAVQELRSAGLDASTIARLRLDLANVQLAQGAVLVVDEMSQVPTGDAAWLLDTIAAVPGGQVWLLGDSHQTGPVGPGGLAHEIERLAGAGTIPAVRLVVNRRQQDPDERHALEEFRRGEVEASQRLRAERGWEHEHDRPDATRQQMAAAVVDDIERHGADEVVVLAVSHADCEDMADRIRRDLAEEGVLGPTVGAGPAWRDGQRLYAIGDRLLIHANALIGSHRWVNGTVVTVTGATDAGITVSGPTGHGQVIPGWFVAGQRSDGTPNVSHAWARTVDGAQGGTWTQVHLLATGALDSTTAYVGQSRGRLATQTWNVAPSDAGDHGGVIPGQQDAAGQVLAAMVRPDSGGFAAGDDPFWLDQQLSRERAGLEAAMGNRPPHVLPIDMAGARSAVERARRNLQEAEWRLGLRYQELDHIGPLGRLTRPGRQRIVQAEAALVDGQRQVLEARRELADREVKAEELGQRQAAGIVWDHENAWRIRRVAEIDQQLARHWAETVTAAVRAGEPLAYGLDRLRAAHHTTVTEMARLHADLPADPSSELSAAQADLDHHRANRQWAEQQLQRLRPGTSCSGLEVEHGVPAFEQAAADLEQAALLERQAADTVGRHSRTMQTRQQALAETAQQRQAATSAARQLRTALDQARRGRVIAAARGHRGNDHLYQALGRPPSTRGGLAAWCALADRIEKDRDRAINDAGPKRDLETDPARRMADRLQQLTPSRDNDARLLDNAADIIQAGDQLDPRPAPDPSMIEPDYQARILDQASAIHRSIDLERSQGMSLGR